MAKWISVKDRLPDSAKSILAHTDTYLACNQHGFVYCTSSHPSWWNYKDKRGREFDGPSVTHWMPLPPPPKEPLP